MADWYLNADTGDDGTGDGSSGSPWESVDFAHGEASSGDTIYLQDSTASYTLESITFLKALTIEGVTLLGATLDGAGLNVIWISNGFVININKLIFTNSIVTSGTRGLFSTIFESAGGFLVTLCIIHNIDLQATRNGVFFFDGGTTTNCTQKADRCLFYDIKSDGTSTQGICFDRNSTSDVLMEFINCTIHFNVGVADELARFYGEFNGGMSINLKNNILLNDQTNSISLDLDGGDFDYNCYNGTFSNVETGTNNITSDPLFIDATTNDYNLAVSSPCLDAGVLT